MKSLLCLAFFVFVCPPFPLHAQQQSYTSVVTGGTVEVTAREGSVEVQVETNDQDHYRSRFILIPGSVDRISDRSYTVSATFQNHNSKAGNPPDFGWGEFGGVMAWFDSKTKIGIGLRLVGAGGGKAEIEVAHFDLSQGYSKGVGSGHFRSRSGNRFAFTGGTVDRNKPVNCQLHILPPTSEDLEAWPEATARVIAEVRQDETLIESVTFLSGLPAPAEHRAGYFGGSENAKPSTAQPIGIFSDFSLQANE